MNKLIEEILSNVEHTETKFRIAPRNKNYAVYNISKSVTGTDYSNNVVTSDITIELYAKDDLNEQSLAIEEGIETNLDNKGINYEKQETIWLSTEKMYMTVYSFSVVTKK